MADDEEIKYPTQYLQVAFNEPEGEDEEEQTADGESLSLDCISDQPVLLGDIAYFRLLGTLVVESVDSLYSTVGTPSIDGIETESITETITFANETEQDLSRVRKDDDSLTYSWIGENPGNIVFDFKTVRSSGETPISGILNVTYNSQYIKVKLEDVTTEPSGVVDGESFDVLVTAMKGEETASATCSFQDPETEEGDEDENDGTEDEDSISLTCISDQPVELGGTAYFKLLGIYRGIGVILNSTMGQAYIDDTEVPEEISEEIIFTNESEKELSRVPIWGTIQHYWIGDPGFPGYVHFDFTKTIRTAGGVKLSGILKVIYQSYYVRVKLIKVYSEPSEVVPGEEFNVLVTAMKSRVGLEDLWASDTCSFQRVEDEEAPEEENPRDVDITVCDYCTGTPLEGAYVYLTRSETSPEELVGTTNSAGSIRLTQVTSGMGVRVVKEGYIDSDKDNLSNDSIPDLSELPEE